MNSRKESLFTLCHFLPRMRPSKQDSEINALWFMALNGKQYEKFFANINAIRMYSCSCRGIELPKKEIICCRLRSYVYVSAACHVIILFYSASLHRWCILLHVSSWGCTREKGINLKFELQGTKTSLIQTLHVIMLHGSISASETIDSLSLLWLPYSDHLFYRRRCLLLRRVLCTMTINVL